MEIKSSVCPHCGYCDHCKRGRYPVPQWPYGRGYPTPYPYPYWYGNYPITVTYQGQSTGNISTQNLTSNSLN